MVRYWREEKIRERSVCDSESVKVCTKSEKNVWAKSEEYNMQNPVIKKGFFPGGAVRCVAGQMVKRTPRPERKG